MIITLTANPSLDRTVSITTELTPGGVHRIDEDSTDPGGKGINVSLGVKRAGLPTIAVLPAGESDPLLELLRQDGLEFRNVPIRGPVRTNIAIVDGSRTTKVNEPGLELNEQEVKEVEETLVGLLTEGDTVMLSGSLAPGFPMDEYSRLIRLVRPIGVWVGVDTSDAPLVELGKHFSDAAPDFLKPNAEELGQLTSRNGIALEEAALGGDLSGVKAAAIALRERGVREVLVTLGPAGAILATSEGTWYSPSPDAEVVSTVGAGDSATAGYLIARSQGLSGPECLAYSVAYGAVAVSLPGTTIPARSQVHVDSSTVVSI